MTTASTVEIAAGVRSDAGIDVHAIDRSTLVGKFGFKANDAKIVTTDQIDIEPERMIDDVTVAEFGDAVVIIEGHVLDEHPAALDADVRRVVPSDCRRRQGSGCQRDRNGQLAHNCPLSRAF